MEILETLPSWSYRQWQEAEQKMRDFNAGTRNENIKACSPDKLEAYYWICCNKGLTIAAKKIEDEWLRRDQVNGNTYGASIIALYKKQPAPSKQTQSTGNGFDVLIASLRSNPAVFADPEIARLIKNSLQKPDEILEYAKSKPSIQKTLIIILLVAVAMNATAVAKTVMNELKTRFDWPQAEIQRAATELMKSSEIIDNIKKALKSSNESLTEENAEPGLMETVEKHDTLNPKIFDGNQLKDEVREKILEIVNKFTEDLEEDGIRLVIKDIVLIGSNVSYNYTNDSDLDIHIIADTSSLNCPDNLYPLIYSAYRSLFNKKFDINFFGIPVELFVEAGDVPTVSNGIYSVKENDWIKEPDINAIPEYDRTALDKSVAVWKDRAGKIISDIKTGKVEGDAAHDLIVKYVEDIYELRKNGLQSTGEYGTENLTFKEIRNA